MYAINVKIMVKLSRGQELMIMYQILYIYIYIYFVFTSELRRYDKGLCITYEATIYMILYA